MNDKVLVLFGTKKATKRKKEKKLIIKLQYSDIFV